MRKSTISLAAAMALTLVLSAAPAWSQAEQRTVVRKTIVDNPSIGVVVYEGSSASRTKLESVLTRCGWFRVMPRRPSDVCPNPDFCPLPGSRQ
jgi:hypothetical protein